MDDILFRRLVQMGKYLGNECFGFAALFLQEQSLEFLYRLLKLQLNLKVAGMFSFIYTVAF